MNTRRHFVSAVGMALLAAAETVRSQTSTRKRRVAYLSIGSPESSGRFIGQFTSEMRELGWIEGSNLVLDVRYAHGDPALWTPLTKELLALRPDVFVTPADFVAMTPAAATKTVPIVFFIGTDPVGRGLVKSLAAPAGNVTGFNTQELELAPKRLALLKEAIPKLEKVGALVGGADTNGMAALESAARKLELKLVLVVVEKPEQLDEAFDKLVKAGATALVDMTVGSIYVARQRMAELAIQHRMAAMGVPVTADSGVLMAYGHDAAAIVKRGAVLVDRILRGTKPADIPVEQPNVHELVVNLRTARALGVELPRSLMLQVTRAID